VCAQAEIGAMSVAELAGQVLMIGTPVGDPTSINDTVTEYHLGGVFLAGRSQKRASILRGQIEELQANAGGHLLIALDQEGGDVQTLQGPDFPAIPSALSQGKLDRAELRSQTVTWASRLAAIGVNLDLAPVADTVPASLGEANPPIGAYHRQYGSNPDDVAADIAVVVPAIQSTGVLTTLKHFPGLGRVRKNTDTSTGAVDSIATTLDPYLAPFISGIEAGTGAVMVSSASYPKLDENNVAAFSKPIITGLLREQIGFSGLVISDDLGAAVAVRSVPLGERAVKFLEAGGDMVLTVRTSDAGPMVSALVAAANNPAFKERLQAAAANVIKAKILAGLLTCSAGP
jgi:beta-N-acetylhexosaminidase